jgi:hypothetical protein
LKRWGDKTAAVTTVGQRVSPVLPDKILWNRPKTFLEGSVGFDSSFPWFPSVVFRAVGGQGKVPQKQTKQTKGRLEAQRELLVNAHGFSPVAARWSLR